MEDQGLRLSSSSFLCLSKSQKTNNKKREQSHTELNVTIVNSAIFDMRPLGNISKTKQLSALPCLGQDTGS